MADDTYRHDALAFLGLLTNGALTGIRFGLGDGQTLMLTIPTADVPQVLDKIADGMSAKARVEGTVVKPVSGWSVGHTTQSGHVILKLEGEVPRAIEAHDIPRLISDLQNSLRKIIASAS